MHQIAKGFCQDDLRLGLGKAPRRLLVALGDAQEDVARGGEAPGERQVDERAERMSEPAAPELGPEAPAGQGLVKRLMNAIDNSIANSRLSVGTRPKSHTV